MSNLDKLTNEILVISASNKIILFEADTEELKESLMDGYFLILNNFSVHRLDRLTLSVKEDAVSELHKLLNDTADKYELLFSGFECNRIDCIDSIPTKNPEVRDECYIFQLVEKESIK